LCTGKEKKEKTDEVSKGRERKEMKAARFTPTTKEE